MADEAPAWLLTMRAISGLTETPGSGNNPKILAMADEIARIFPEMKSYCEQYQADSTPWCGLCEAYTVAKAGIRPPFGSTDTEKFLWARAWAGDPGYTKLATPRLGCIVVLTRSGGGHVTTYESDAGSSIRCRGGNQSDQVSIASFPKSSVIGYMWPKAEPLPDPIEPEAAGLPELRKGSTGKDVVYLQTILPKWIDGDFGATTESLVKEFQRAHALAVDGVVGPQTWAALQGEDFLPTPPPPVETADWIQDITATMFGGAAENEPSAYPPYDLINASEISIALPDRFASPVPEIEVRNSAGDIMRARIRDIGPWMIDDPYWATGARPIAETCYKNKTPIPRGPQKGRVPSNPAGIDLSEALAKALGIKGMGKVSWRFAPQ